MGVTKSRDGQRMFQAKTCLHLIEFFVQNFDESHWTCAVIFIE